MTEPNSNVTPQGSENSVPPMPSSQGTRPSDFSGLTGSASSTGAQTTSYGYSTYSVTPMQAAGNDTAHNTYQSYVTESVSDTQTDAAGDSVTASVTEGYVTPESTNYAPQHAAPSKKVGPKTFLYGFAGAAVACICAFGVAGAVGNVHAADTSSANQSQTTSLGAQSATSIDVSGDDIKLPEVVADKCLPSVAFVTTYVDMSSTNQYYNQYGYGSGEDYYGYGYGDEYGYGYGYGDEYGYGPYGYGSPYDYYNQNGYSADTASMKTVANDNLTEYGTGSGVVLSADGYIITNNHVVEGGSAWTVTVNGKTYDCDLVGTDPSSDVAVLKAKDVNDLIPMEIGDSDDIQVGEWVMTLGSPFGLETSVATGIVSATNRSQLFDQTESGTGTDTLYPNMIQTDAAINPGNSGGALVNAQGQLIGINTLIISYSNNYSGVGFAIPSNYAIGIAEQLINGEELSYAQLGVSLLNATDVADSNVEGALVAAVVPDSPAAQAGIQEGDIITGFNGRAVTSASDLMLDVRGEAIGSTVSLTIDRNGETIDLDVTLGSSTAGNSASQQEPAQEAPANPNQR